MTQTASRRDSSHDALGALVLLVTTVVLTHDCYFPLNSLPYPSGDQGQMLWNLWHTVESVSSGKDPYLTRDVLYPGGANLVTHTLVAGLVPLTLAVKLACRFVGAPINLYPFVAYKLAVLTCFWSLATFTWLFFRRLGATWLEGLILAIGYAFTSFYRMHANHLNHLCGFFYPLTGLAVLALLNAPSLVRAGLVGFTIGISIYFTEFTLFICMACLIYAMVLGASREGRAVLRAAVLRMGPKPLALSLLTFLVTIAPFVAHWAANDAATPSGDGWSANLIGYFVPSPSRTSLYAGLIPNIDSDLTQGVGGKEVFVGFPFLILGLLGWSNSTPWIRASKWTAILFFVLALGPHLLIYRANTEVPLPFEWLRKLPVMRQNRTPIRFVSVAMFFWSMVVFAGLKRVAAFRLGESRLRWSRVVFAALGLWIAFENYGHADLALRPRSEIERLGVRLGNKMDLKPGAVLNLPMSSDFGIDSALQIFHGRPIATGYLARYSTRQLATLDTLARRVADGAEDLGSSLRAAGFATVIVKDPITVVQQERLRNLALDVRFLGGQADRRAVATFGVPMGVGDGSSKWSAEDRLGGTRRYDTVPVFAKQLDVLADDNDTYIVELFTEQGLKTTLTVPTSGGGGLRWRVLELPLQMAMHPIVRVDIRPGAGDGVFAVRAIVLGV